MDEQIKKEVDLNTVTTPTPVETNSGVPSSQPPIDVQELSPALAKRNKIFLFAALLFVTAILLTAGYFFLQNRKKVNLDQPNKVEESIVVDESGKALISYIPNFENLKLEDFPNFQDFRNIYEYKNNLIIAGYPKIAEYDPKGQKIVRINNTAILNCGDSTAKINNFLYVACNTPEGFAEKAKASKLYKIDLESGEIVKEYFGEDSDLSHRKVNINLESQDDTLWISSWDGVIKMDTKTDNIESYSPSELFGKVCRASHVFDNKGTISVLVTEGTDCGGGVAVYKPGTDKWDYKDVKVDVFLKEETDHYTNLGPYVKEGWLNFTITPNFEFPTFYALSSLIDNKYYVLASDGLYSLEKMKFPQKQISSKIIFSTFENRVIVSKDQKNILFLSRVGEGPRLELPLINETLGAYVLNLQTNTLFDLMKDERFNQQITSKEEESVSKLSNSTDQEENGIIIIKDKATMTEIMTIDFANSRLEIK